MEVRRRTHPIECLVVRILSVRGIGQHQQQLAQQLQDNQYSNQGFLSIIKSTTASSSVATATLSSSTSSPAISNTLSSSSIAPQNNNSNNNNNGSSPSKPNDSLCYIKCTINSNSQKTEEVPIGPDGIISFNEEIIFTNVIRDQLLMSSNEVGSKTDNNNKGLQKQMSSSGLVSTTSSTSSSHLATTTNNNNSSNSASSPSSSSSDVLEIVLKKRHKRSLLSKSSSILGVIRMKIQQIAEKGSPNTSAWFPLISQQKPSSSSFSLTGQSNGNELEVRLSVFWTGVENQEADKLSKSSGAIDNTMFNLTPRTKIARSVKESMFQRLRKHQSSSMSTQSTSFVVVDSNDNLSEPSPLITNDADLDGPRILMEQDSSWQIALNESFSRGSLQVTIYEAKNLIIADVGGKSDPYVIITCKGQTAKTKMIRASLNPVWNESFVFGGNCSLELDDQVHIHVKDWDLLKSHDDLGEITISLQNANQYITPKWFKLQPTVMMPQEDHNLGWIRLSVQYTPSPDPPILVSSLVKEAKPNAENDQTSTIRVLRPKVYVRALQARNLVPADANGKSDPYCKVKLGTDSKRTKVCRKTLNPQWNEFFSFGDKDYIRDTDVLHFHVYDKDLGIGDINDDELGVLHLPLSIFSGKDSKPTWFVLESPKFPYSGEIQLLIEFENIPNLLDCKISSATNDFLLTPGITPRSALQRQISNMSAQNPNVKASIKSKAASDIYKGKIWLYELQVTVIGARNLTAADTGTRSSDPYCVLKCGADKWRTKIIKKSLNPIWNERFKFRHPDQGSRPGLTTSDRLRISVYDWDLHSADDPLGQINIDVAYIVEKLGYIDIKGKSFTSWFALEAPSDNDNDSDDNSFINNRYKVAADALGRVKRKFKEGAKRAISIGSSISAPSTREDNESSNLHSYSQQFGSVDAFDDNAANQEESTMPSALIAQEQPNNSLYPYGQIRLTLKLLPIGETRLMKKSNFVVRLNEITSLSRVHLSPVDDVALTEENETVLNKLPSMVYARVMLGSQIKDTLPVPARFAVGGAPLFHSVLVFTDDIDWLLNASIKYMKNEKQRRKLEAANSRRRRSSATTIDTFEEDPALVKISICNAATDEEIADYSCSLSELLPSQALLTSKKSDELDNIQDKIIPLSYSPTFSTLMMGAASTENENENPVLKANFSILDTKEEILPVLGNVYVRLISAKLDLKGFYHTVRVAVRYGDKLFVTRAISGDPNPEFEAATSSTRFSVTDMFTPITIEVWRSSFKKGYSMPFKGPDINQNVDIVDGDADPSDPLSRVILPSIIGADGNADGDDDNAGDRQEGNVIEDTSGKLGRLFASCTFTIYDLIEQEAQIVFADQSLTKKLVHTPFKLPIRDKSDKVKGNLWISARFVENEAGILSPNPNPALRPKQPFSLTNVRHEINRTVEIINWVRSVAEFRAYVLDWENPPLSLALFLLLIFFCILDHFAARFLLLFPLGMVSYIIRNHIHRQDGTFEDYYSNGKDDEKESTASVKIAILAAENLLVRNSASQPQQQQQHKPQSQKILSTLSAVVSPPTFHQSSASSNLGAVHCNIVAHFSLKKTIAKKSETLVGWTRTVAGDQNPVFASAKAGFGVQSGGNLQSLLTSWKSTKSSKAGSRKKLKNVNEISKSPQKPSMESLATIFSQKSSVEVPAFEVKIKNEPLLNPLLSVVVWKARNFPISSESNYVAAYIQVSITNGGETFRTIFSKAIVNRDNLSLSWDERFFFGKKKAVSPDDTLNISLYSCNDADQNVSCVGSTDIKLSELKKLYAEQESSKADNGNEAKHMSHHPAIWLSLSPIEKRRRWPIMSSPGINRFGSSSAWKRSLFSTSSPNKDDTERSNYEHQERENGESEGEVLVSLSWLVDTRMDIEKDESSHSKSKPEFASSSNERKHQDSADDSDDDVSDDPDWDDNDEEGDDDQFRNINGNREDTDVNSNDGGDDPSTEKDADDQIAPDSWKRTGTIAIIDVFNVENGRKIFLGRGSLPIATLIQDESVRDQPTADIWLDLGKKMDGSRDDSKLEMESKKYGTIDFGKVLIRAAVKLPDPLAKERRIALEEARRADKGNPIQKIKMINSRLEFAQNLLYNMNNRAERVKNLFNWSNPKRTEHIFKLLLGMLLFFAVVPSRFIFLVVIVSEFTEHFRPLGTSSLKYKHMLALLPTDDDLRNTVTGELAKAKRRTKELKKEKLEAKKQILASVRRYVTNQPLRSESRSSARASSRMDYSDAFQIPRRVRSGSGIPTSVSTSLLPSSITLADTFYSGILRILHCHGTRSFISKPKFSTRFCAVTGEGLYYWNDRSQAESSSPLGCIQPIANVIYPVPDVIRLKYASACGKPQSLFYIELLTSASVQIPKSDEIGEGYLCVATSISKAQFWITVIRGACLLEMPDESIDILT